MAGTHAARHSLPISNGYGSVSVGDLLTVTVWCGICRDNFTPDAEWGARMVERKIKGIERAAADPSQYGISRARADHLIAEVRAEFERYGLLVE